MALRRDRAGRFTPGPAAVPTAATPHRQTARPGDAAAPAISITEQHQAYRHRVTAEPLTLLDADGTPHTVIPGDLDSARDVLTAGQCHNLAAALHQETGWPIVAFFRDFDTDDDETDDNVKHYGVLTPDGYLLDGDGAIPLRDFQDRTGLTETETLPPGLDELADHITWDTTTYARTWHPLSPDTVRSYVEPVLHAYHAHPSRSGMRRHRPAGPPPTGADRTRNADDQDVPARES